MKTQSKKENVKSIILVIIILIIIFLIIFSEDIIKLKNKNNVALLENTSFETMINKANEPRVSAGMIPVKYVNGYWTITTKYDEEWYDYANGQPAYVILNDGTYQSELIRDMGDKKLAEENIGIPIAESQLGTIFTWIPRFAYKENGEIKYAPTEMQPGGEWIIPKIFSYEVVDETKPDFSLGGVWIQTDVDTEYKSKITEMQKEEGIYGFLANTKSIQITADDIASLQKYIGDETTFVHPIVDITDTNRIILKIIDTTKREPIKANAIQNTIDSNIEIQVTYTSNGIKSILDENGNEMTFTEKNGILIADTGKQMLVNGKYYFTVIDNKENRKELEIDVLVNSLYKVAYVNGIDNMTIETAYAKNKETKTTEEIELLDEISTRDTSTTYIRAIEDGNNEVTAIGEETRTDESVYVYRKYNLKSTTTYSWYRSSVQKNSVRKASAYGYPSITTNSTTGEVKTSGSFGSYVNNGGRYNVSGNNYYVYSQGTEQFMLDKTMYSRKSNTTYSQGTFITYVSGGETTYPTNGKHDDSYWYVRETIMPKYTLYKYDENLNLKSIYNVDTKELIIMPIDISSKGENKLKLTLNTSGSDYKTYISNDNASWQEVTDIISGEPKELEVEEWDKLYIKIETNTSRIDNIDVGYYK